MSKFYEETFKNKKPSAPFPFNYIISFFRFLITIKFFIAIGIAVAMAIIYQKYDGIIAILIFLGTPIIILLTIATIDKYKN